MDETEILRQELENYKQEKDRIRKILGQIGGNTSKRKDQLINIGFLLIVLVLFSFEVFRNVVSIHLPELPPVISLELALLLVSLKIVWMIHQKTKVDHFQFWVLNSIEFQVNAISKRLGKLERTIKARRSA